MKNCIYLTLLLFIIFSCSSSGNSESKGDQQQDAEAPPEKTDSPSNANEVVNPGEGVELIDRELLSSEPQPFTIASYYKFYSKDLEEAKRVLTTPWDDDMKPGFNSDFSDKLDTLDTKAGYMEVKTPLMDGFQYTQYVYWNLSDGRKLFAMNEVGMEPFTGEVTTDAFEFRIFNQDRWEPAEIGDLQELGNGGLKRDNELRETALFKKAFSAYPDFLANSFVFYLPQKGKDIRVVFTEMDDAVEGEIKTITLKFNNGRFEYLPD